MFQSDFYTHRDEIIKIIGIGGGGCNAVNYMSQQDMKGVKFFICNTDAQSLETCHIENKIHIGPELTQGLGAGSNPEVGRQATIESEEYIKSILSENTKMVFITAGMGGGTGTGGAPIIAKIAQELGILTIGIVTTPFRFEGKRRMLQADEGIKNLKNHVDTLLIISNEKLKAMYQDLSMSNAFNKADDILLNSTKCVTDVINTPGKINVDFADVCTVMRNGGVALFGNAEAAGENRAEQAILNAIYSPLLNENNIAGAKWILLNISSPKGENEVTMQEIDVIQDILIKHVGENSNVILGTSYNSSYKNQIGITLIATDFQKETKTSLFDEIDMQKRPMEKASKPAPSVAPKVETATEVPKVAIETEKPTPAYTQISLFENAPKEEANAQESVVVLDEKLQNSILNERSIPSSINMGFSIKKPQAIYQSTESEKEENDDFSFEIKNLAEKDLPLEEKHNLEEEDIFNEEDMFTIRRIDEKETMQNRQTYAAEPMEENDIFSRATETVAEEEEKGFDPFLSQEATAEEIADWNTINEISKEAEKESPLIEDAPSSINTDFTKLGKGILREEPSFLRNEAIKEYIQNNKVEASNYRVEGDVKSFSKINALNQFLFGHKPD